MAIPTLTNKYLPPGIFDCTVGEIETTFGTNIRRKKLFDNFCKYLNKIRDLGISGHIVVNGSFVTSKAEPGDIDMVLVLDENFTISDDMTQDEYEALSQDHAFYEYELHLFVGFENDESSEEWIALFSGVREDPDMRKGLLKVKI